MPQSGVRGFMLWLSKRQTNNGFGCIDQSPAVSSLHQRMTSGSRLLSRYHRHGDADAFCALVRDHAGMVFSTAKRVTRDAALAEDVAQETFLELARNGHVVESVAAWLHRVAWRKACDVVRSEVRRRYREKAAAEALPAAGESAWKDVEPLIDEVLEELPAPLRETLVEHFLEG